MGLTEEVKAKGLCLEISQVGSITQPARLVSEKGGVVGVRRAGLMYFSALGLAKSSQVATGISVTQTWPFAYAHFGVTPVALRAYYTQKSPLAGPER